MSSIQVINTKGQVVKEMDVAAELLPEAFNPVLVHTAVVMQRASARQGTVATKGRGEVSGTGRKPWKQKHTGRARAGSNRSPIWRHGGTAFGPQPRRYGFSLPKQMYKQALRNALASKNADGALKIVTGLRIAEPKTRLLFDLLRTMGQTKKALVIVQDQLPILSSAARNMKHVKVIPPAGLNVYDALGFDSILVSEDAFPSLRDMLT